MRGLIHVYCGDGKGKTTVSVGLSIRAAGRGKKVLYANFLKTDDSGEIIIMDQIENITVMRVEEEYGFIYTLSSEDKEKAIKFYSTRLERAIEMATKENYDVLVLDEILASYTLNVINRETLLQFLKNKPEHLEVILTGRDPAEDILEYADYVSEIQKVKHPFDKGVPAREGIEY
ncbi:cob(I)alamin adenosyltransferase [Lachnospiraceae bacterium KM106-2]|nr:cob(I)alamin adenosyltransferase [Lachnospiraceae bacterium KM106-2]